MAPTARLPPKKDVALALLEQASMYIHLDPRSVAVQVPAWFKKQPQLVLQVGLNMAVPIPDLHVDERGLSCTLSFNRSPFFCMIPWPAVFALVGEGGQAMVWAEDVPAEVAAQAQAQKAPPAEKPRPHLRSVGDGETQKAAPSEPAVPAPHALEKKGAAAPASKAGKTSKLAPLPTSAVKEPVKRAAKSKSASSSRSAPKAGAPKPVAKLGVEQKARVKKPSAALAPARAEAATRRPAPARKGGELKGDALKGDALKGDALKGEAQKASTDAKPKRELPPYLRVVK